MKSVPSNSHYCGLAMANITMGPLRHSIPYLSALTPFRGQVICLCHVQTIPRFSGLNNSHILLPMNYW